MNGITIDFGELGKLKENIQCSISDGQLNQSRHHELNAAFYDHSLIGFYYKLIHHLHVHSSLYSLRFIDRLLELR